MAILIMVKFDQMSCYFSGVASCVRHRSSLGGHACTAPQTGSEPREGQGGSIKRWDLSPGDSEMPLMVVSQMFVGAYRNALWEAMNEAVLILNIYRSF